MRERRKVSLLRNDNVNDDVIRKIIRDDGNENSGEKKEKWKYVVIYENEVKKKVREIVEEEEKIK